MIHQIYLAGPFSAPIREGVEENIRRADLFGLEIVKLGAHPWIPHKNTSHPDFERLAPYDWWIEATSEWLLRSDAVFLLPGWKESRGAKLEKFRAEDAGIPCFESFRDLELWLISNPPGLVGRLQGGDRPPPSER